MHAFKNILVAVDLAQQTHPELERASQIARYSGGRLHIVDVLRDLNMATRFLAPKWQTTHEELAQEKGEALEELAQSCREQGIESTSQLLRGHFSQQLLEVINSQHIDLLVRSAKGARSSETGYLGSTSSELLRRAPCALWLTQGAHAAGCKHILAAVDATPDDEAHAALNRQILRRSLDLVAREGCDLQVVYVWDVYGAELLRDRLPESDFEEMLERNRAAHEESYERVVSEFNLHAKDSNVHMLRGEPTVVVPEFCRKREIDLMVCGTVSRVGISGMMLGNTANRMLKYIPCSILALKPEAVAK
jgi:nucleotide-binding universal stress UspA family protein